MPDHPLKKNEILDIFYNGLTDASRDFLDSCAGCVFTERTIGQAEELLNNILKNLKEICPRGNNKVIIYFLISW